MNAAARAGSLLGWTHAVYALHTLSVVCGVLGVGTIAGRFVFGLPSLLAVVMNYARRAEAEGTWLATHFRWQIRTFWFAFLWSAITMIIAAPLTLVVVGVFVAIAGMALIGLWVCYRIGRGWLALRERQPMPDEARA